MLWPIVPAPVIVAAQLRHDVEQVDPSMDVLAAPRRDLMANAAAKDLLVLEP